MKYTNCLFGLFVATIRLISNAEIVTGYIVSVSDGDTVTLLDRSTTQHRIRLVGIDAPESSQSFGQASKKNLSNLVFNRKVQADCTKKDRYKRRLCKLLVDGNDVNYAQIQSGFAWHYKKYQSDQNSKDRALYSKAEQSARMAELGLWADPHPIPPWEYRQRGITRRKYSN